MVNPYRNEYKTTQHAKGKAMGVEVTFLPDRASRISGTPNAKTVDMAPAQREDLPQMLEDKQGPGYANDASGWVRGAGESGEGKPGFDSKKSG